MVVSTCHYGNVVIWFLQAVRDMGEHNEALTLPIDSTESRYESRANKLAKLPVNQRWMTVLSYHLAGKTAAQIAKLMGYSPQTVRVILANKRVNEMRQLLLQSTQEEFEALFATVTDKIRQMLGNKDTVAEGIRLWTRLAGRREKVEGATINNNITAEDVVFQMLNNTGTLPPHSSSPRKKEGGQQ
jgi:predicted transcriptional regulator